MVDTYEMAFTVQQCQMCDYSCSSLKLFVSHVIVQESDEELIFVEEPKMAITDQTNSTYTKYITDSIAYHDEPLFLKMREVP